MKNDYDMSLFLAMACNDLLNVSSYQVKGKNGYYNGELIATNVEWINKVVGSEITIGLQFDLVKPVKKYIQLKTSIKIGEK